MGDHPLAADLAEANGRTYPDVAFLSAGPRSSDPVEAVTKGHVAARSDAQVANLVANRTLERGEPIRPVFL